MEDYCKCCLYSESYSTIELVALIRVDLCRCTNINSPYYEKLVGDDDTCRLFLDYGEYIKMKDRKESLIKLKENIKRR